MLGDTGKFFHIPNEDLKPESMDTYELLTRAKIWRIHLTWVGYVSYLDDLIKREPSTWQGEIEIGGKPVYQNVNGSEGMLWGTEGEVTMDIGHGFSLAGHINYTWGVEKVPGSDDVPLTRIPPLYGMGKFRYETVLNNGWHGFVETYVRGAAKQDRLSPEDEKDIRIPEGGTPGWYTLNLRVGLDAVRNFRALMTVENLLDEKYKYHASGVYSPGMNVVLALEASF
jgi:outer membrane receptor protein involved in Fe transport